MSDSVEEIGLAEAIALRLFPDYHAMPVRLYVGDDSAKKTVADWKSTYSEMMSKPTNISKEAWHEECLVKLNEREG